MSDQTDAVVDRYGRFARDEAPGRSALYEEWARGIAEDRRVAALIARIGWPAFYATAAACATLAVGVFMAALRKT